MTEREHTDNGTQHAPAWDEIRLPELDETAPPSTSEQNEAAVPTPESADAVPGEKAEELFTRPEGEPVDPVNVPTTDLSGINLDPEAEDPSFAYSPRRLRDNQGGESVDDAEAAAELERQAQAEREAEEAARKEAERAAAERAARNRALGVVAPAGPQVIPPPPPQKLVTDKFVGAAGLFFFRLIVAGVLGIRGYQLVTAIPGFQQELAATQLPEPNTMAWVAAISLLVLAVAFLFGAFVRVAGLGLLAMSVLALVYLRWGPFSPFVAGEQGFIGELELLLAGVGLVFLCLGGGRWGVDGSFRAARARAKAASEE